MRVAFASLFCLALAACGTDEPVGSVASSGGAAGASGSGGASGAAGASGAGGAGGAVDPGNATFSVRGSVEQVHVWKAAPATGLELVSESGVVVASGDTDDLGSLVFRKVPPGSGYRVRTASAAERSGPIEVWDLAASERPRSFYESQALSAGSGYLTTRDGTKLAVYVTLPGPIEDGPYPTVVNYSGYDPARPGEPMEGMSGLCGSLPVLCDAPADGSALVAAVMGYATVGVNMRGTGCSGGAYDFFEDLQLTDGYDAIEVVAAQPWVLHGKVGMTGLSYPGISQMFVAKMHPPGLAAITPLSVIGNTFTTLVPGGILNDGFALSWADGVLSKASPYAQGWEQARVDAGDTVCEENQLLHGQKVDILQKAYDNPFYSAEVGDPVNPETFVDRIEVPVFFGSAFQDEQTGPYFFTLLSRFSGADSARFTVYNGVHVDGFAPALLVEWHAFLELFVAQRVPVLPPAVRVLAPALVSKIFGASVPLPPDRFASYATHAEALAAWKAEPRIRVLYENGGGATDPGAPAPTFERSYEQFPPTQTTPRRWYFTEGGILGDTPPAGAAPAVAFTPDLTAADRGILAPGGGIWDPLPAYDWPRPVAGAAAIWETAPLSEELIAFGSASVDLWVRSTHTEADLEVTLSEIRPDGNEMYIQSGWLRASQRALAAGASELWPAHTHLASDVSALVPGEWVEVRVGVPAFAHVLRAGSRLRVTVDAPGESRAEWRFAVADVPASTRHSIGQELARPSSVALSLVGGAAAPTPLPPCPSLRGQPCRAHEAYANTPE
ncbi:MAG: CocE/NonD family hydrolase [Polyangiaceae bacterium]|nr:CocE/NonD family hydrolase [Polyangiaceae bacterium]